MTSLCPIERAPAAAVAWLEVGEVVALPSETVYGLACNAFDAAAVARIFEVKERPYFDPLIVHIADQTWLPRVTSGVPPLARHLAEEFWPGPLTLVLPKHPDVSDLVTAGLPRVAVRCPDHPLFQAVLQLGNMPLAAPSANLFGRLSPTTALHVQEQLGERIPLTRAGGPSRVGVESTILRIDGERATLLRAGGLTIEELERVAGPILVPESASDGDDAPQAPGMLESHYAPTKPLRIVAAGERPDHIDPAAAAWLGFESAPDGYAAAEILSRSGDLREAAANLFPALHRLEASLANTIIAELVPEEGLGRAINDRLRRAAAKRDA